MIKIDIGNAIFPSVISVYMTKVRKDSAFEMNCPVPRQSPPEAAEAGRKAWRVSLGGVLRGDWGSETGTEEAFIQRLAIKQATAWAAQAKSLQGC